MIDTDELRDRLSERDLRQIFEQLGFEGLRGEEPNEKGWIGSLYGPPALGEGSKGNFAVNLYHGGVRDHGDEGYSGDVIDAVRNVKRLDFQEALEWIGEEAGIDVGTNEQKAESWKPGEGEVLDTYPYRTADGELLFEQVREAPPSDLDNPNRKKSFYPRVRGEGMGLHGRPKIPYRLPEWSAQTEDTPPFVTYHEGEKDVDNAWYLGIPATTTPFGANSFDSEAAKEHFEGLNVAIFPDNDPEGESHAKEVAEALLEVAESVKIVRLEDRPEDGGDVSDWIEQKRREGWNEEKIRETIMERIDAAERFTVPENGKSGVSTRVFWYVDEDAEKVKIDRAALIRFLEERGFGKLYYESDLSSILVRVVDNVARRVSRERIKDFALEYVRTIDDESGLLVGGGNGSAHFHGEYDREDVVDALLRGANVYFSDALFEFLSPLDLDFHRDTPEKAFFYYQNGFVEVTAEGYELRPYSELDGAIWKEQIIDRGFVDLQGANDREKWVWNQHLWNVAGHDRDRHAAICSSLGYLQHTYKDPAVTKAIIFMDEKVADVEEGRTGKSLTAEGLQKTRSVERIDGRNFTFHRQFTFQQVDPDTQIIDFNDIKKGFPFSRLFSVITDDMDVEEKGEAPYKIPFERSPKFLLSTNYVMKGEGASFDDRTHQVEFSSYYSTDHTPEDEFGHRLFSEWDEEEWTRFDNTMMSCVQLYLDRGLVDYEHKNLQYRKLRQETSPDFAEWIRDYIELGRRYEKKALCSTFRDQFEPDYQDLTSYKFTTWVKTFARIYDLDVSEPKSGATRYIVLRSED